MEVEPVLLARARQFPSVDVRFGLSVTAITQNEDGVAVTIAQVDDGPAEELRAGYLVGCDGGRSIVRRELGLRFAGEDALQMDFLGGRMLATYFRAPTLLERFPHPDTWMHWVMQPSGRAILLVIDPARHEFLVHFQLAADMKDHDIHFSARLASILGESVPHEIISQAEWRAGVGLVADRYGVGRCFLAGDAVHLFTPTGGFGLNTGIEDSFNLGWKLAAVCHGIAPPTLLETYQTERRPVALRNVAYALELARRNGQCPVSPALDADTQEGVAARAATAAHLASFARWEFDTPGIQLGARYDGSPIIIGDGSTPPADSPIDYIPSGVPGGRLPHVWLRDGAALFDRLGRDFTLILLDGTADAPHWSHAADALGLDLSILQLVGETVLMSLIAAPAVLIRPDQHIAWRGRVDVDPAGILNRVTGAARLAATAGSDALAVG
jgi:2-polyprenyl-6-methoxyphenol hydroxylase-like FAD-dependent oxidoreductase